jgi:hypothetical protein
MSKAKLNRYCKINQFDVQLFCLGQWVTGNLVNSTPGIDLRLFKPARCAGNGIYFKARLPENRCNHRSINLHSVAVGYSDSLKIHAFRKLNHLLQPR